MLSRLVGSNARGCMRRLHTSSPLLRNAGRVKFFDTAKGFGFIENEGNPDVFIHYSDIKGTGHKSLADGEEVEYDIEFDDKKQKSRATNVTGPGGVPVQGSSRQSDGDLPF